MSMFFKVLRRFPTMPQELAELYATNMMALASQARGVIRDLNPKVNNFYIKMSDAISKWENFEKD